MQLKYGWTDEGKFVLEVWLKDKPLQRVSLQPRQINDIIKVMKSKTERNKHQKVHVDLEHAQEIIHYPQAVSDGNCTLEAHDLDLIFDRLEKIETLASQAQEIESSLYEVHQDIVERFKRRGVE